MPAGHGKATAVPVESPTAPSSAGIRSLSRIHKRKLSAPQENALGYRIRTGTRCEKARTQGLQPEKDRRMAQGTENRQTRKRQEAAALRGEAPGLPDSGAR